MKIIDCLNINFPHLLQLLNYSYNRQILKIIQNSKAITATNALVNGNLMGGVSLITTKIKEYEIKYKLFLMD